MYLPPNPLVKANSCIMHQIYIVLVNNQQLLLFQHFTLICSYSVGKTIFRLHKPLISVQLVPLSPSLVPGWLPLLSDFALHKTFIVYRAGFSKELSILLSSQGETCVPIVHSQNSFHGITVLYSQQRRGLSQWSA